MSADESVDKLFHEIMYNDNLSQRERRDAYDKLVIIMYREYGIVFERVTGHDTEDCIEEDCSYCGNPKNNVGDKWDIEYVD